MQIIFKLHATLTEYLPAGMERIHGTTVHIQVPEGTTVQTVIEQYRLPEKLTHLVLVNGVYFAKDARATKVLSEGDALAIWPPIAGG
jgi:sulfur carrier protein ThiS